MQPVSHKYQDKLDKAIGQRGKEDGSRQHYLYYTHYKRICKAEGFEGNHLYIEGMRRAKAQILEEQTPCKPQTTNKLKLVTLIKSN